MPLLSVMLPVGVAPEPDTVTFTETDCAAVMLAEAGVTVTVGVVGFWVGGGVLLPLPPPQAEIAVTRMLAKRRMTVPKPFFTFSFLQLVITGQKIPQEAGETCAVDATDTMRRES